MTDPIIVKATIHQVANDPMILLLTLPDEVKLSYLERFKKGVENIDDLTNEVTTLWEYNPKKRHFTYKPKK